MFVTHLVHPLIAYRGDVISESEVTLINSLWELEAGRKVQ
jgi:hypothetical protein